MGMDLNTSCYMQTIKQAEQHLLDVTTERSVYKAALDKAKSSIVAPNGEFSPPPPGAERPSNTTPIEAHYSFDMAQQVFYPNDPLQPGPMYFLTLRKCAIFGVCCEAIPRQINYLINEAVERLKCNCEHASSLLQASWARRKNGSLAR